MNEQEIKCHTCSNCGKFYENHSFLCMDDVCLQCHGSLEQFVTCGLKHQLLALTQCGPLRVASENYPKTIDGCAEMLTATIKQYLNPNWGKK